MTAVAVAIASSVFLTLGGCASSAGIESAAHPLTRAEAGLGAGTPAAAAAPIAPDWW